MPVYVAVARTKTPIPGRLPSRWNNIGGASRAAHEPTFRAPRATRHHAVQKRVRMPIVPTTWFAVLDAPPDVLMNAW